MNYASESAAGVSPLGLVVRLYESIVADLGRAILALRDGDIEKRSLQLEHALLLIAHLESSLDLENGGEPAHMLDKFYSLARTRILQAQIKQSGKILEEIAHDFLSIRDAWAQIEQQQASAGSDSQTQTGHVSCVA